MPAIGERRSNISEDLHDLVRQRIVDGVLSPGTRVNEVHLAADLGISRTPLREALSQLTAEGFLEIQPRRGYFTRPLTVQEVSQLYPLRAFLDPQALRMAGVPTPERIAELRRLNDQIAAASRKTTRAIDLDDRWHRLLLADCENEVLLGFIDQIIWKSRRYEFAYLKQAKHVDVATTEHEAILAALEDRQMDLACEHLAQNMTSAREPLIAWLKEKENQQ